MAGRNCDDITAALAAFHLDTVCMFVFYVAFGHSMIFFLFFSQVPNSNILTSPVAELQLRVGSEYVCTQL